MSQVSGTTYYAASFLKKSFYEINRKGSSKGLTLEKLFCITLPV